MKIGEKDIIIQYLKIIEKDIMLVKNLLGNIESQFELLQEKKDSNGQHLATVDMAEIERARRR